MKRNKINYTNENNRDLVANCIDSRNEYICDAISETADSNVDIYTSDLLEWAAHNYEYCDEAAQNGLVDMHCDNIMVKLARAGQYEYYTQELYKERAAIVLEYAFEHLGVDEIDDDLAEILENKADDFDRFNEIDDEIDAYMAEKVEK